MTNTPECPGIGRPAAFLGRNQRCQMCNALVDGVPGGGQAVLGYHLDRRALMGTNK